MRFRLVQRILIQSFIGLLFLASIIEAGEPFDTDQKVHKPLLVNQEQKFFFNGTHYNQTIYLKYTFEGTIDKENDLLLLARPNDFLSDPDMFVSRTIEFPTPENADYKCWHAGMDICYIPTSIFEQSKVIYVTLFSFQPYCNFTFEANFQHRTQQMVEWNKDTVLFLGAPGDTHQISEQVVKIYLPPDQSIQHFTFSAIVDPRSRQNLTQAIQLYVMFGNETPSNSRSLWGIYSSVYGETFTAFNDQPTFRTGTNYTMLIVGQTNTTINLYCRKDTFEPVKIKFNGQTDKQKTLYDAIPFGHYLTYELDTSMMTRDENTNKLSQSLLINLLVQQGNPDMYIECDQPPTLDTLQQAKWISDSNGVESLLISAQEFQKYKKQCNYIYITIFARVCAAFALELSTRFQLGESNMVMPLYPSISENGYIEDNQIVNYLLQISKSTMETVTVSLLAKNGNPDLYVKKCKNSNQCKATRSEIENVRQTPNDEYIGLSNEVGNDYITFQHSEENCSDTNSIYCFYLVTVYANPAAGNSAPTQEIHYSLLVQFQSKSVQLFENNPLYQKVDLEQFNYYSYFLVSLEGIKRIYFQVTPISGIMELLVSRFNKNPNFRETEKIACFCSNVISYSIQELTFSQQQNINFYMGVYGFSNSIYTISVYIERYQKDEEGVTDENQSIISMKLLNEIPQKYVYESASQFVFFDVFETQSDPIISLNPLKGDFAIEAWPLSSTNISKYSPPGEGSEETVYKSTYNSAILHVSKVKNQDDFKGFRIRVQKLANREQAQFIIDYSTSTRITTLYENIPMSTYIQPDSTKFFKFTIYPEDYVVAVSYTSGHQGLVMQIAGDEINKDDSAIKYETTTMSESSIYMFNAFNEECASKVEENRSDCVLYGLIEMSEKAQESYTDEMFSLPTSISLIKFNRQLKTQGLQLQDGQINYYPIPTEEINKTDFYTFNFYVHPTSFDTDIQTIATLEHGNMKMKFKIQDTSLINKPDQWEQYYPQLSDIEKRNLIDESHVEIREKQSQMINIPKRDFSCQPHCVVLISVFAKNVHKIKQNSQLVVQFVSDIMDLTQYESIEITGTVVHGAYQYYRVYLPQNTTVATFSAVALQSKLDINIVSYFNISSTSFRPTETNCKEKCKLSNLEPGNYDMIEYSPAYSGYYIIGVFGSEGITIEYKFSWTVNSIQQIKSNQSYRSHISQQKSFIFYADLFQNKGFQLSVSVFDQDNNDVISDGVLSLALYHCNSDFMAGCIAEDPDFKTIKLRDYNYNYSDICKNDLFCTVVLTFKSIDNKNIIFDFLVDEIKKSIFNFQQEVISLMSDSSFVSSVQKNENKRYQIILPEVVKDDFMLNSNYILRVQQITGSVNISLWPKELHTNGLHNTFSNIKWIEIEQKTLLERSRIHVDVFECKISECRFDIVLYQTNMRKDISKLQAIAEYLNGTQPLLLTGKNGSFKRSRLIIYYESKINGQENKFLVVEKQNGQIEKIQMRSGSSYYIVDNLYDENIGIQEYINLSISLQDYEGSVENQKVPVSIFLMKIQGSQIPLQIAPASANEYLSMLQMNKFSASQTQANYILEVPPSSNEENPLSTILIDLRSCGGQISLQGSTSLDKFEQGIYELSIKQEGKSKQLYSLITFGNKKVFLNISRPSEKAGKELNYLIGSYTLKNPGLINQSPVFKTETRNGFLELTKQDGKYVLSWDMLSGTPQFSDPQKVKKYTEFIFIIDKGSSERVNSNLKCNLSGYEEDSLFKGKPQQKTQKFSLMRIDSNLINIDDQNQVYYAPIELELLATSLEGVNLDKLEDVIFYATLKAQISPEIYGDSNKESVWFNEVDYQVITIDNQIFKKGYDSSIQSQSSSDENTTTIIIMVTLLLGMSMVLLGVFLYRRYRLTKKRVEYEVSYREEKDFTDHIENNP